MNATTSRGVVNEQFKNPTSTRFGHTSKIISSLYDPGGISTKIGINHNGIPSLLYYEWMVMGQAPENQSVVQYGQGFF
jgi:hypothetical protein